jgi:hypothetical protein
MSISLRNQIAALAHSPEATSLFPNAELFQSLFYCQTCIQFLQYELPLSHCLEVYDLIRNYITGVQRWGSVPLKIDRDTTPILGLFHHIDPASMPAHQANQPRWNKRWEDILRAYIQFNEGPFSDFLKDSSDTSGRKNILSSLGQDDSGHLRVMRAFMDNSIEGDPQAFAEFSTLLFFDTYAGLLAIDESDHKQSITRAAAYFSLSLLPQLLGPHGFGDQARELQDYAFWILDPKLYGQTEKEIDKGLPSRQWYEKVRTDLEEMRRLSSVPFSVTGRKKSTFSALAKSAAYGVPVARLWDLYGFRIVVDLPEVSSCYEILSEVQHRWQRWEGPRGYSDYIRVPKQNGYRSIHVVIENASGELLEIQIRTAEMNFVAEFGTAAHFGYKVGSSSASRVRAGTPLAEHGRRLLERTLERNGLSINDFILYLGERLDHVGIDHYYEGIASGRYQIEELLRRLKLRGDGE